MIYNNFLNKNWKQYLLIVFNPMLVYKMSSFVEDDKLIFQLIYSLFW
jgi:hypothetical protein